MKKIIKHIGLKILAILGFCLAGYLALVCVYCIPTGEGSAIYNNIVKSLPHFENETHVYTFMESPNSELDMYSDAMYLLEAGNVSDESPFVAAIRNVYKDFEETAHPLISILTLFGTEGETNLEIQKADFSKRVEVFNEITGSNINADTFHKDNITNITYGRYWHGYLIFLKPLIALTDYGAIRTIIMFITIGLFIWLLLSVYKKFRISTISIFLLLIFFNPVSISLCFMYFPMNVLTLSLSLIVVKHGDIFLKRKFIGDLIFLLFGCASFFFDVMTYPFVCYLIPIGLLCYQVFLKCDSQKQTFIESLRLFIRYGIHWAIGFLSVLGIKLLLLYCVCGQEDFTNALTRVNFWTSEHGVGFFNSLPLIFTAGIQPLLILTLACMVLYTIYLIIKNKQVYWGALTITIILSLIPCLITLILDSHTTHHLHYTYREFAITWLAISNYCCFYYYKFCKEHKIKKFFDTL